MKMVVFSQEHWLGKTIVDAFYGYKPEDGLHILKDVWGQKTHLGAQSELLAQTGKLSAAIAATFKAAPERHQGYSFDRNPTEGIHESEKERRLEGAMMERWGIPATSGPISGVWDLLVAFQVPLFANRNGGRWGYIDLLGVNTKGLPVVIELKKAPNAGANGRTTKSETPMRIVLEAAAYAVALRKNWERFRSEWVTHLTMLKVGEQLVSGVPKTLETVPIVGAAPASYWMDWLPVTEKGREVPPEAWQSFKSFLDELKKAKLPVLFISISGHDQDINGLAVQPLEFPLIC